MVGILLVAALLAVGFLSYSPFFARHNKALASWLVQFVSPCCKPAVVLARASPTDAPPAAAAGLSTDEKHKEAAPLKPTPRAGSEADLESVFRTFDGNGDGFITTKELEESLRRLGLQAGLVAVNEMLQRVDSNGDGLIDLDEFRDLYASIAGGRGRRKEARPPSDGPGTISVKGDADGEEEGDESGFDQDESELRGAFEVFDRNGDGLIGAEELKSVLSSTGLMPGATEADCREMIKKVDLDGDGMVDFHEFKRMMNVGIPANPNQAGKEKLL